MEPMFSLDVIHLNLLLASCLNAFVIIKVEASRGRSRYLEHTKNLPFVGTLEKGEITTYREVMTKKTMVKGSLDNWSPTKETVASQ